MARRWLKIGGGIAASVTTIIGLFLLLQTNFGFEINDLTGDIICEGTYENPCISEFEVKNPTRYDVDIYSKDQVKLDFSPGIYDYGLFVPDGRCSATGKCACELKDGRKLGFKGLRCVDFTNKTKPRTDKVYNFRFKRYSTTVFTLAGIKNNPSDDIKWGFGTNDEYLDPIWEGIGLPTSNEFGEIKYDVYWTQYTTSDGRIIRRETKYVQNIFEDGVWKDKKNAKSLMNKTGFKIKIVEEDYDFVVRIIDYNFTSSRICLSSKEINKDISFEVYVNKNEYFYENGSKINSILEVQDFDNKLKNKSIESKIIKNKKEIVLKEDGKSNIKSKELKINFIDDKEKCFDIILNESIFYKNFKFGFNSTTWIYQEDADQVGFDADWLNPENIYDGDWDTHGDVDDSGGGADAFAWFNYTKPVGSLNGSLWEIKDDFGRVNLTLLYPGCFDQEPLQFQVRSQRFLSFNRQATWYCWTGGSWYSIRHNQGAIGSNGDWIYEEAMNWLIDEPADSCTYSSGNWEVDCSDNCTIESNTNIGGNNLSFTGAGDFRLNANISGIDKFSLSDGCKIILNDGVTLVL